MNQKIIAHREAGHAVADIAQELRIKKISIIPDGRSSGRVERYKSSRAFREFGNSPTWWDLERRHKDRFEKEVRSLLAGRAAKRRFAPRSVRAAQTLNGHEGDLYEVHDWLSRISTSDRESSAYLKLFEIQTEWLLNRFWTSVEAIADARERNVDR